MATLVINHCRGHYLELRNASSGGIVLAYVQRISGDLSIYRFFIYEKGRECETREPSARISAALICFARTAHCTNTECRTQNEHNGE